MKILKLMIAALLCVVSAVVAAGSQKRSNEVEVCGKVMNATGLSVKFEIREREKDQNVASSGERVLAQGEIKAGELFFIKTGKLKLVNKYPHINDRTLDAYVWFTSQNSSLATHAALTFYPTHCSETANQWLLIKGQQADNPNSQVIAIKVPEMYVGNETEEKRERV